MQRRVLPGTTDGVTLAFVPRSYVYLALFHCRWARAQDLSSMRLHLMSFFQFGHLCNQHSCRGRPSVVVGFRNEVGGREMRLLPPDDSVWLQNAPAFQVGHRMITKPSGVAPRGARRLPNAW